MISHSKCKYTRNVAEKTVSFVSESLGNRSRVNETDKCLIEPNRNQTNMTMGLRRAEIRITISRFVNTYSSGYVG